MGLGLTTVIGSGIWKDSLLWSNAAGVFSLPALVVGWILMLTVGLSYAECVGMFPQGGGPYSYVQGAFGKKAGAFVGVLFIVGYIFIATILSFLTALFALAALSYPTFDLLTSTNIIFGTALIIVLFSIAASLSSLQQLGRITLLWVVVKIILVLGVFAFVFTSWTMPSVTVPSLEGMQSGINNSIWALLGFEVMLVYVSDTENPSTTVPKAVLRVLPIILIIYLIVTLIASGAVAVGSIPSGETGSISMISRLASLAGLSGNMIFAFASFSAAGTAYAMIATLMRQTRRLAEDKVIPSKIGQKSYSAGLITIAVLVAGLVMTILLATLNDIVDIFAATGLGLVLISTMLPAGFTALMLRIRLPALNRPFKTPLYQVVYPFAVILAIYLIYLNYSSFLYSLLLSLIAGILTLIIILVFPRDKT